MDNGLVYIHREVNIQFLTAMKTDLRKDKHSIDKWVLHSFSCLKLNNLLIARQMKERALVERILLYAKKEEA